MTAAPAIVAGNWKMNTDILSGVSLASAIAAGAAGLSRVSLILGPPFVSLAAVREAASPWPPRRLHRRNRAERNRESVGRKQPFSWYFTNSRSTLQMGQAGNRKSTKTKAAPKPTGNGRHGCSAKPRLKTGRPFDEPLGGPAV